MRTCNTPSKTQSINFIITALNIYTKRSAKTGWKTKKRRSIFKRATTESHQHNIIVLTRRILTH